MVLRLVQRVTHLCTASARWHHNCKESEQGKYQPGDERHHAAPLLFDVRGLHHTSIILLPQSARTETRAACNAWASCGAAPG